MSSILDDNFKIIAYRGGTDLYPENSIEAIEESLKSNSDTIIEIDLQITKDKVIVAFHDFHLDQLTNGNGNICDFKISELKKLYIKNPNVTISNKSRIPTLEEIFDKFRDANFVLDVHEKNKMLIEKLIEIIEKYNFQEKVALVSMVDGVINEFRKIKPNWTYIASPQETKKFIFTSKFFLHKLVKVTSNIMFLPEKVGRITILNKSVINELHRRNIKVWSCINFKPYQNVNSLTDLQRLKKLEVDGVYTNNPRKIIDK